MDPRKECLQIRLDQILKQDIAMRPAINWNRPRYSGWNLHAGQLGAFGVILQDNRQVQGKIGNEGNTLGRIKQDRRANREHLSLKKLSHLPFFGRSEALPSENLNADSFHFGFKIVFPKIRRLLAKGACGIRNHRKLLGGTESIGGE